MPGPRQGFVIYHDDIRALSNLTNEQIGELVRALCELSETGEDAEVGEDLKVAYSFMRQKIVRDAEKYEERREKNRKAACARYDRERETGEEGK